MPVSKPFHRNVRGIKHGPNSGYSSWAYIRDRDYATSPSHYTRALTLILDDLRSIFDYVEPSDEGKNAFSYRIHELLMRTCIEVETNFKAIFDANIFSKDRHLNMRDYRKIDVTHHLSSYEVILPMWNGASPSIKPFEPWRAFRGRQAPQGIPLPWYQAYNNSKHNRQEAFKQAHLWALIEAAAGLLILVTAQFGAETFDAGPTALLVSGYEYHPFESSTGSLFRIKYPEDWNEEEIYDFDWSNLKLEKERFQKINYNGIVA